MKAKTLNTSNKRRQRLNQKIKIEALQKEKDRQRREAVMHVSFTRYNNSEA